DWRHVNFFGGARTLQVQSKYSSLSRGIRTNLRQPYLFGPRLNLIASAQYWHDAEPAFTLNTRGGRVTFERELRQSAPVSQRAPITSLSATYTNEYQDYVVADFALHTPSFYKLLIATGLDPLTGRGKGTLSSLDFDVHRSTADNTINARRGYTLDGHFEQAGRVFGGDFQFFETVLEGRYYQPAGRVAVLAVKVR